MTKIRKLMEGMNQLVQESDPNDEEYELALQMEEDLEDFYYTIKARVGKLQGLGYLNVAENLQLQFSKLESQMQGIIDHLKRQKRPTRY